MSGQYELPDEQVKGTDGEDLPARIEEAQELTALMERIRAQTNDDGTLRGVVKRVHFAERNPKIAVMVELPAEDEQQRFTFTRPKAWVPRYDFVRFVDHYADHPADIDYLVEGQVAVEVVEVDGDYKLVYPTAKDTMSAIQRARCWVGERVASVRGALGQVGVGGVIVSAIGALAFSNLFVWAGAPGDVPVLNPEAVWSIWELVAFATFVQIFFVGLIAAAAALVFDAVGD